MLTPLSRRALAALGAATFALTFGFFAVYEVPNAGIGRVFYLAVALVALATGPFGGAATGLLASALYALGVAVNPHLAVADLLSVANLIRDLTYVALGYLVGWFAATTRGLMLQLRILAERDPVTGIGNLRSFESMITRRLDRGETFTLLVGDCEGAEEDGDHAAPIETLMWTVSERLARELGQPSEVARTGEGEFAVLVSRQAIVDPAALANRLEQLIRFNGHRASFGWALHPEDGTNALALYRAAMERLYLRKTLTGRRAVGRSRTAFLRSAS